MATMLQQAGRKAAVNLAQQIMAPAAEKVSTLVFLGPPGVGKGTYSSRVAEHLGIAHISVGDIVRNEIKHSESEAGRAAAAAVARGDLLSDDLIFELLANRIVTGREQGEEGFLLDGFPRTGVQAETLLQYTDVKVAVNMHLREDVLLAKCLGRRICAKCGNNYNVADIRLKATDQYPSVVMPPLPPSEGCKHSLVTRADDNEETFRRRMEVYQQEASPVEDIFRKAGLLLDFHISGGIPQTMPLLMDALRPYSFGFRKLRQREQLRQVA